MRYVVKAMSVDPQTGDVTGQPSDEVIDTEDNVLFLGADGRWDVEDRYLAFWNRLDPSWEDDIPGERVVVLTVTPA